MRWIKNSFFIIFSAIISLIIAEFSLRLIFPYTPICGSYFPRYIIDNNPFYASGLTKNDPFLPFSAVSNYSHTLSDLAYHPKPYKITLDGYGYRNTSEEYQHYDNIIVGDSVAFGAGVDDDQTVAAILGQRNKVYNFSISGAGPEMYMAMIDSFLKRKTTDKITILFFLGNDIRNLNSAYWDGLADCLPPINCKIKRTDVSASPESPPLILSRPFLRDSYLSHLVYMSAKNIRDKGKSEDANLSDLHSMISVKAIADLKNHINRICLIQGYKEKAIGLLEELITAECADDNTKIMINKISDDIKTDNIEDIFEEMQKVTMYFINKSCYPIGKDWQNLASYANYYAGFVYETLNTLKDGYTGNLYNYISLLKMIGRKYSDLKEPSERLIKSLPEMKNLEEIERYSYEIERILKNKEPVATCYTAQGYDRLTIFLEYLAHLAQRNIEVSMYLIPAEYQLGRFSKLAAAAPNPIWIKANEKRIVCIDLTPKFVEHYSNKQNNALYLDGAHFTIEGNQKVAKYG